MSCSNGVEDSHVDNYTDHRHDDIYRRLSDIEDKLRCDREPEPKTPTHEEIMTKWWEVLEDKCIVWVRVLKYEPQAKRYSVVKWDNTIWDFEASNFVGCKSADIPPEES